MIMRTFIFPNEYVHLIQIHKRYLNRLEKHIRKTINPIKKNSYKKELKRCKQAITLLEEELKERFMDM